MNKQLQPFFIESANITWISLVHKKEIQLRDSVKLDIPIKWIQVTAVSAFRVKSYAILI